MNTQLQYKGFLEPTRELYMDSRASAMKGDIIRALVELITNSEDAEASTIDITITRKRKAPSLLTVTDNGSGMSAIEMRENLTKPGNRTSGFHTGSSKRGLHGRGAKDVSYFGCTTFESVKDGLRSVTTIQSDLSCTIHAKGATTDPPGTTVTIEVIPGFTIPSFAFFKEKFPRHFILQDVFAHTRVSVTECSQTFVIEPSTPLGTILLDKTINMGLFPPINGVLPMAHVTIKTAEDCFDDEKHGPMSVYRYSGLIVKSGVAIHEKHLFNHESSPEAQSLFGTVECPYIDELVRSYDSSSDHPRWNNVRALDERRDGLIQEHPVLQELYRQVNLFLDDIVNARKASRADHNVVRSNVVDKWLRDAMKRVSLLLEQKMEGNPFLQERTPSPVSAPVPQVIPDMFGFLPATYQITPGRKRKVTVAFKGDFPDQPNFDVQCSEPQVTLIIPDDYGYVFDPESGMHEWTAYIEATKIGVSGTLTATFNDHVAQAHVKVVQKADKTLLKQPRILDEDWGSIRVKWSTEDPGRLEIAARHPGFAPYLGKPEDGYPGKESEGYKAVLAESIAEALTWRVLEKRYASIGSREDMTATDYYTEHSILMRDFLSVLQ